MKDRIIIHSQVLNKFNNLKGENFTKFKGVFTNVEPDEYVKVKHHLLSSQRGVYVPKKYNLAYSIKIDTTSKNYYNKISYEQNKFVIKYYLPSDNKDGQKQRDIAALYKNFTDKVPLGVVLKKESGYEILGLGEIKYFFNDYIIIETFLNDALDTTLLEVEGNFIDETKLTEKKYMVNVRLVQSHFRKQILDYHGNRCVMCDIELEEVLVASHIKPWNKSSDSERLDKYNGLPLCSNHDALFDKGLISFNENNELIISSKIPEKQIAKLNITPGKRFSFDTQTKLYLKYHLQNLYIN